MRRFIRWLFRLDINFFSLDLARIVEIEAGRASGEYVIVDFHHSLSREPYLDEVISVTFERSQTFRRKHHLDSYGGFETGPEI